MRLLAFVRVLFVAVVLIGGAVSAIATISSAISTVTVPGNGAQTSFSFPFIGVAAGDITVVLTNSAGAQTTLVQGPGTTQYQVTLNAIVAPNLWGVGGAIAYNPSGTPVPAGSTLTITRVLPFLQTVSLQNQASFGQLAQATEQALDLLDMQIQQLATTIGNVIKAPLSDPAGLVYTLPSATARANQFLCFDGSGNVIACASVPAGTISSAMQPVVNASSLAAGRTAFGLGTAATGTINYGLQQGVSGAGLIDVNQTPTQDSTNQTVTAAFHQTLRVCTGPITYTLPRGNTTWAGFGFWVYAVSGLCTITPNAADNFLGVASGTGVAVNAGSWVYVSTSAASSAVWWADYHGPTNTNLAVAAGAGAVTFTFNSGPLQFRDTTIANGDAVWSLPATGIAITIPSTATLGSSSNVPFRVWIFVAYNAGTPILGVATCSAPGVFYACRAWENLRKSGTGITTGSTAAGTLYTSASTSNDSVIIIGYADFCITASCTAGTWVAPTTLALCLAPRSCLKPGETVQTAYNTASALTSQAITPASAINQVEMIASANCVYPGATATPVTIAFKRSSTALVTYNMGGGGASSVAEYAGVAADIVDNPNTASSVTYSLGGNGGCTGNITSTITLHELMGALDLDKILPANDNQPLRKVA